MGCFYTFCVCCCEGSGKKSLPLGNNTGTPRLTSPLPPAEGSSNFPPYCFQIHEGVEHTQEGILSTERLLFLASSCSSYAASSPKFIHQPELLPDLWVYFFIRKLFYTTSETLFCLYLLVPLEEILLPVGLLLSCNLFGLQSAHIPYGTPCKLRYL